MTDQPPGLDAPMGRYRRNRDEARHLPFVSLAHDRLDNFLARDNDITEEFAP